jgi:hypothetical protein
METNIFENKNEQLSLGLQEEIKSAIKHDLYEELKNPKQNNLYSWTEEEALEAIKNGKAHGFLTIFSPIYDDYIFISAIVFDDKKLGEKVAKGILEEFDKY